MVIHDGLKASALKGVTSSRRGREPRRPKIPSPQPKIKKKKEKKYQYKRI